ncbi:hypothetical protein CPSG_02094 [Coccidioides posadasii str. Silveira]|uniref:Uncharacterized protein n=1 Tax=Coccidioides posadasii (strain RMSCC 757 / Silveira) TaxID=443226 RepID=E9CXB1_COCPS|nr:hypothetical protein CPSG_02094 [Coccidioides posadasii str. Silveira]
MCTWHTRSAIAREQGPSKRCTCAVFTKYFPKHLPFRLKIHLAAESLSRWVISSNKCCASRTASASTATSSTTVFPNIHYWRSPLPVIRRKSTEQHHTILPGHRTGDILAPHPPDGLHHGGHRHGRPTVRSAHPDMNGGRTGGADTGDDDGGAELGPPFP